MPDENEIQKIRRGLGEPKGSEKWCDCGAVLRRYGYRPVEIIDTLNSISTIIAEGLIPGALKKDAEACENLLSEYGYIKKMRAEIGRAYVGTKLGRRRITSSARARIQNTMNGIRLKIPDCNNMSDGEVLARLEIGIRKFRNMCSRGVFLTKDDLNQIATIFSDGICEREFMECAKRSKLISPSTFFGTTTSPRGKKNGVVEMRFEPSLRLLKKTLSVPEEMSRPETLEKGYQEMERIFGILLLASYYGSDMVEKMAGLSGVVDAARMQGEERIADASFETIVKNALYRQNGSNAVC